MKVLIKHEEIVDMCRHIGKGITNHFKGREPLIVAVLKGACPFHSELIKHINLPLEVDYIEVSSYSGTESTGKINIKKDISINIEGRDVIIVEDIVDTGITLSSLKSFLEVRKPNSLTFVSMLDKPSKRKVDFKPDFIGKTIDDLFVVGFGLDLDEKYRNLKDIFVYENNEQS